MSYAVGNFDSAAWIRIRPCLLPVWASLAERRGWPDDLDDMKYVLDEDANSWLCIAPVFARGPNANWYFFRLLGVTYCFGIGAPSRATLEFHPLSPRPSDYSTFKYMLTLAFKSHGFSGLKSSKIDFQVDFPEPDSEPS